MRRPSTFLRCFLSGLFATGMLLALWALPCGATTVDTTAGVGLRIALREILQSDPPETTVVETLGVSIALERETTLRLGNFVLYITAQPGVPNGGPPGIRLTYSLFSTGPTPEQRSDIALVEYDTPLVVDELRGKGKSIYRLLIVPHPAPAPPGRFLTIDTAHANVVPATYYLFHLDPRSRAMFHLFELRSILGSEYEHIRDTFGFTEPGRLDYYFFEGACRDVPFDPRFDFAIDPSRNRIVARYDREYSGVDAQASVLLSLYRWWGYAPELLALGASGYLTSADFDVINDRDSGRAIPLDSLARTLTFRRQPFPSSLHHAASFVRWLISTRTITAFHDAYSRATDLSLERALWSVYGKTLKELEGEWLAYLKKRRFGATELYLWAMRAAAYHRYTEHFDLLQRAITAGDTIPPEVYGQMGLAAGQLGRWPDAVKYLLASFKMTPNAPHAISLLAEALWANGQVPDAEYNLTRLVSIDSANAGAYLLLGDIQQLHRRSDSAAAFWRKGLADPNPGPVAIDLLIRLGNRERRRSPDSCRVHLARARTYADQLLGSSRAEPMTMIRYGEALMATDSTELALSYFRFAAYIADSPQELGRIYLGIGHCQDLARRRQEAIKAYEYVFRIPATYYDSELARYYVNHVYKH